MRKISLKFSSDDELRALGAFIKSYATVGRQILEERSMVDTDMLNVRLVTVTCEEVYRRIRALLIERPDLGKCKFKITAAEVIALCHMLIVFKMDRRHLAEGAQGDFLRNVLDRLMLDLHSVAISL